ncbi:MAG: helix-turn-helix transcriptional regulator [Sphingobacteriales bacterium]|nr:helix-turn-helix transcriptional regulator [Sphingobacteriales bacterium]
MEKIIHQGKNIKRFREMLGFKQEGLAIELGDDWTQKKISLLEQKEVIEPELLEKIAKALKVPAEALINFDEEVAVFNIQNNYEGSQNQGANYINHYSINPIEKWLESLEEIKKLYERLLESEKQKVALLEEMLKKR